MMEFWVNSSSGIPYFFVTARVNEKMPEMPENGIIPRIVELHPLSEEHKAMMEENPNYPRFTLVFDREGYSHAFFRRLWEERRIAIITYRKNVKDKWRETDFKETKVETFAGTARMKLSEQELTLEGYPVREVRKISDTGRQTSIVTTNKIISTAQIASYMFGRWIQENFFRYMRQEYAIDKIIRYGMEEIDDNINVVNREYSNITYRIKKSREKLARRKAAIYNHQQQMPENNNNNEQSRKIANGWKHWLYYMNRQAALNRR
jgi:hypothetical protein